MLKLLSDGEWHSSHQVYALRVVAHSRVAELRKRGHVITCARVGDDYFYRLHLPGQLSLDEAAA